MAQSHLRSIASVLDIHLMGQPEIYFTMKPGLIDDNSLVTDEKSRAFLQGWVDKFTAFVSRFAAPKQLKIAAE